MRSPGLERGWPRRGPPGALGCSLGQARKGSTASGLGERVEMRPLRGGSRAELSRGWGREREVKIEENTERGVLERLRAERESIFKCMRTCSL